MGDILNVNSYLKLWFTQFSQAHSCPRMGDIEEGELGQSQILILFFYVTFFDKPVTHGNA